jgi:hypothetical protein
MLRTGRPDFDSRKDKRFSRRHSVQACSEIQLVPEVLFLEVNQVEGFQLTFLECRGQEWYTHTSTPAYTFVAWGFFLWGGTKSLGRHNRPLWVAVQGLIRPTPYTYKSLGTAATSGLLYKPQMIDEDEFGAIGGMKIGRGNRSTRRKPVPAPLCPTTNPTWPDPGSNPGRHGGKPATNLLSYGAVAWCLIN